MKTMSPAFIRIALAGATLLLLAACGNKGPLVMPQKPVPVEAQPVPEPDAVPPKTQDEPAQPQPATQEPAETKTEPTSGNER